MGLEAALCPLEESVSEKISRFVPMRLAVPTQEELTAYNNCYQLELWVEGLIDAMSLFSAEEAGSPPQRKETGLGP